MSKNLKTLLQPWTKIVQSYNITGIASDSRKITTGNLFCALQGNTCHGKKFIQEAIDNGAIAILCEIKKKNVTDI
ncbi:MAG: Mur ligase domain-containing protein [Buchnera aphidicola (Kaburagia rhusicola rhusicola)]